MIVYHSDFFMPVFFFFLVVRTYQYSVYH